VAPFARLALIALIATCALGGCIGPGLEPPGKSHSNRERGPAGVDGDVADASTPPGGNFGNAGGTTGETGTTNPPAQPTPTTPPPGQMTDPDDDMGGVPVTDEDAGTDPGDSP
jgi:hypothetical protein